MPACTETPSRELAGAPELWIALSHGETAGSDIRGQALVDRNVAEPTRHEVDLHLVPAA
jgi:hypothetical protein